MRLEGRRCLIVGGTGGMGLAAARRFLAEGARLAVSGPTEEAVRAAAVELDGEHSERSRAFVADVIEPRQVAELFSGAVEWLGGRLDVLLHVAGISGRRFGDGPLHECTDEGWERVLDTNARGVFLTNREAARRMRAQEPDRHGLRGTVVNVGSVSAFAFSPEFFGTYAYAASKGAVRSMTLAAAARYAPEGVRFNLLSPGLIDTPMAARACGDERIRSYIATKQPIAGGPGTAEDCAEAALYLCEPASRFVTGVELPVDGGWSVSEGQRPHD